MENNVPCKFNPPTEQIEYCFFESLNSTHTFALNQNWYGRLNEKKVIVIFAAQQTEGWGTHQRVWCSSSEDFHVNFVFLWDKALPFSQIAAFTACQFLNRLTENNFRFQLKWPNDVYIEGHKIGGCLSHVRNSNDRIWVTVGIGLNFNLSEEVAKTIDQPATSLKTLLNNTEDYPTSELFKHVQTFSELFVQNLHWYRQAGMEHFFNDALPFWLYHHEKIRVYNEDRKQWWHGTFEAVDAHGALVLKSGEKNLRTVLNGTQLEREKDSR